jgi:hypothetical protein
LIENDPAFDANMQIPLLDLETLITSQGNRQKTTSQMSPQSSQLSGSQNHPQGFEIRLNIDHSSSSSYHGSPFGLEGKSSAPIVYDKPLVLPQDLPPDDDVFGVEGGWGLDVDENGNIIELVEPMVVDEEPQLPPLPPIQRENNMPVDTPQLDMQTIFDDQGDVIMQEEPLPEAEPFPERQQHTPWQDDERPARQALTQRHKFREESSAIGSLTTWSIVVLAQLVRFPRHRRREMQCSSLSDLASAALVVASGCRDWPTL